MPLGSTVSGGAFILGCSVSSGMIREVLLMSLGLNGSKKSSNLESSLFRRRDPNSVARN